MTVSVELVQHQVKVEVAQEVIHLTLQQPEGVRLVFAAEQGPPGAPGSGITHYQNVARDVWIIQHNLGFKPAVDVYNTGSQQISADVTHPDNNSTRIEFLMPVAGFARLA